MFHHVPSQLSVPPYKSNPLFHGYCGLIQFMLWSRGSSSGAGATDTETPEEEEEEEGEGEGLAMKGSAAVTHAKRALKHFENMEHLEWTNEDNLDAFISIHVQVN